jgi:probable rRNA maturation factor
MNDRAMPVGGKQQITVEISDTQSHLPVDRRALERLVHITLSCENRVSASISIALVDNAAIQVVNRTHLGHDWPTDVISFPLSERDDPELAGELVVSTELARDAASALGRAPLDELALYVVHGLLHLCGYDDHDDADIQTIRCRESEILALVGLNAPPSMPPLTPI